MNGPEDRARKAAAELDAAILELWNENSSGMACPFPKFEIGVSSMLQLIAATKTTTSKPGPTVADLHLE